MQSISGIASTALVFGMVTVFGFGPAHASDDETLRIRTNADLRSIDPGVNRDLATDLVMQHMVEGLVAFREDATVAPMLASNIDVSDDETVYTFTLRDDVVFHNGERLTVEDVVFAWNRYMDPETNWYCRPQFVSGGPSAVESVEVMGDDKVVFTLENPSALFLFNMARFDCGSTAIYHRDSIDPDGTFREPVATGPFKLNDWRRGQYIELARFDQYSALEGDRDGYTGNKTALVDKVRFLIIPDAAAAKTALLAGNVDVDWQVESSQVADYRNSSNVEVTSFTSMNLTLLLFQTRSPKVADVRIRQAIEKSLDLEQIAIAINGEEGKPGRSLVPAASPYFQEAQAAVPERDVEGARALLAEAGYSGEPIRIVTSRQFPELYDISILIQAMALEAGINLQIDVTDWASHGDRLRRGDYEMMAFGYGARLDPSIYFDVATGIKDEEPNKVWDSADAKAMIQESMVVGDMAERQRIFDALEEKFRAEIPLIPLFSRVVSSAHRNNIENYKADWTIGLPRAWGVTIN